MLRKLALAVALAAGLGSFGGSAADAAQPSAHNPYASFNSGVNYGAQRWEHQHRLPQHRHFCARHR